MNRRGALGCLLFALAAGCGAGAEKLVPVGGALTAGAKPVPGGNVTFYPDAAKGNTTAHQPTAVIAGGRFELFVTGGRKGAPPGWYKVVVYAVDNPQPNKPNRYLTDPKYADLKTTPLSVEVVENPAPDRYDLKLDR